MRYVCLEPQLSKFLHDILITSPSISQYHKHAKLGHHDIFEKIKLKYRYKCTRQPFNLNTNITFLSISFSGYFRLRSSRVIGLGAFFFLLPNRKILASTAVRATMPTPITIPYCNKK
jgi:hypothetical protein